ncbi:hypothetical protein Zmor_003970 [Zophobas morio]|uniref:Uncharacterized protein n=1 Tax=Zophobas morio TaxID=2755281 RepID=A0AA38LZT4_9CUCU|nr:hypothetical protein Zmor_003970 [Zophobas morio]
MTFAQDCLGYPSDSENGWEFSENCAEVLLRGPEDNDEYWDAWNAMLDRAIFKLEGGTWPLYQDGDLWAVNWDWMTIAERLNWMDVLGKEPADLFELTGTADDRDTLEELMAACNVAKENYRIEEHGFHSLWLHIIDSHNDMLVWRAPTFQADFQHDVMREIKFCEKWISKGATWQTHSGD